MVASSSAETDAAADPFGLTPREREVLRLVADGCSNNQIAHVIGRAYGLALPVSIGGIAAGSLVAGPLVARAGTTGAFAVAALMVIAVCGLLVRRPLSVPTTAVVPGAVTSAPGEPPS